MCVASVESFSVHEEIFAMIVFTLLLWCSLYVTLHVTFIRVLRLYFRNFASGFLWVTTCSVDVVNLCDVVQCTVAEISEKSGVTWLKLRRKSGPVRKIEVTRFQKVL